MMKTTLRQRTGKRSNAAGRQRPNATAGLSSSRRLYLGQAASSRFGAHGDDSGILKQVTWIDSGVYCDYFLNEGFASEVFTAIDDLGLWMFEMSLRPLTMYLASLTDL